jgi:hypothetical protein
MKKVIAVVTSFLVGSVAFAQSILIDTVYTRQQAHQTKDWNYFLGYFEFYKKDSADHKLFKRIKAAVLNQNNGTIITIDSIPGKWSLRQVEILLGVSGGEYRKVDGDAVITHLKSKAQLTAKINELEAPGDARFKAFRDAGRLWAEQSQ